MSIKKILTIIILIFILTNICTYSFAGGIATDDIIDAGITLVPEGLEDATSLPILIVVGIYRIIQIFLIGWALLKLTWLGIKYFTTASMLSPQELKNLKNQLINHFIKACIILGAEGFLEVIFNALINYFTS